MEMIGMDRSCNDSRRNSSTIFTTTVLSDDDDCKNEEIKTVGVIDPLRSHGDREDGTALSHMTLKNEDAFNEGDENNTLEKKCLHQTRTDRQTTTVTSTFEMFDEENNCNDEESVKTQRKEILPYFYNLKKSPPSSNQSMHSHFDYDNCSYESLNSDDDSDPLICFNVTQKHVHVPNEIQVASSQCVNPGMEHMNDLASVPDAGKQLATFRDSLQSTHGSRSEDVIDLTQDCASPIIPRQIPHGTLIYSIARKKEDCDVYIVMG
jgi:hypothetical protein